MWLSYSAGGNVKHYKHFGKFLPVDHKFKHTWIKKSGNYYPKYLSKTLCPLSDLYMDMQSSFTCNNQNLEIIQLPLNTCIDKQFVVPLHTMEYYSEMKKEHAIDALKNMNEYWHAKNKKVCTNSTYCTNLF